MIICSQLEAALAPIAGELIAMADFAAGHLPEDTDSPLAQLAGIDQLPEPSLARHRPVENSPQSAGHSRIKTLAHGKTITKAQGFPADQKQAKARMLELLELV